jgi:hypothetical protein
MGDRLLAVSNSALRNQKKEAVESRNFSVSLHENRSFLQKNAKNKAISPKN